MKERHAGLSRQHLSIGQLIQEFTRRTEAGESLSPEVFIAAHSEHAADLHRYFASVRSNRSHPQTEPAGLTETLIRPSGKKEVLADDPTAETLVCAAGDSETSISQNLQQNNSGSTTNFQIPESFGRYAIRKVLGQGAMGAVYLAWDTQLDRNVALKIPKFGDVNGVADDELLARFYREAKASATIRSLNVCPVYDVGKIDGQHYITMAFIEGRPLKHFTKSKKSHSEKQIITIIRKLALGLEEAHKIGVVHRDLKPANIMVDLKGEPVVMDFGLARRNHSDDVQVTQSGAILGTPAYMAPEQVAGDQAAIDHRVDIYALGVIMYELITGEMPFKGNLMAILQQIALNNPKKPSELRTDIDPGLETICLKMMAGDQKQRYQSMNDLAADLQDVLRSPGKRQKKEQAKKTGPKPTSIPSAHEESNPALISVEQPKSYAEQLREKNRKPSRKTKTSGQVTPKLEPKGKAKSGFAGPPKTLLIVGGLGGLVLLLGIVFLVRVGKYDVQITLEDPSITLSVDGGTLNINNGSDVIKLKAGEHKLQLEKDGLTTHVEAFTVAKDGKTALTATVVNGKLDGLLNGERAVARSSSSNSQTTGAVAGSTAKRYFLRFDGLDDHVVIPDLRISKEFLTVEAIIHGGPQASSNGSIFIGDSGTGLALLDLKATGTPRFGRMPDKILLSTSSQSQPAPAAKAPVHVAGVWDGTEISLFVDGNLVSRGVNQRYTPSGKYGQQAIIGAVQAGAPGEEILMNFFHGDVHGLKISSTPRYTANFDPAQRLLADEKTIALYHFDEGTGDVLKDFSGNGHDGRIVGAKWVNISDNVSAAPPGSSIPGKKSLDYALEFDGSDDYLEIPSLKIDASKPLTFEAWCLIAPDKPVEEEHLDPLFVTNTLADQQRGYVLIFDRKNKGYWMADQSLRDNHASSNHLYINGRSLVEMHHVAAVWTASEKRLYVDGKLVAQGATPLASFATDFNDSELSPKVGSALLLHRPIERYLQGMISEIRISQSARYDKDFLPVERFTSDDNTLVLYHFDEGSGDVLEDSSGNGHDGRIVGATWVTPAAAAPPRAIDPFDEVQAKAHQED